MQEINENPLITLAVFTYNQEQFVAEAFSAAIAQEYEPLEIIFLMIARLTGRSKNRKFIIKLQRKAQAKGKENIKKHRRICACGRSREDSEW